MGVSLFWGLRSLNGLSDVVGLHHKTNGVTWSGDFGSWVSFDLQDSILRLATWEVNQSMSTKWNPDEVSILGWHYAVCFVMYLSMTSWGEDSGSLVFGTFSELCPICFFPLLILTCILSL